MTPAGDANMHGVHQARLAFKRPPLSTPTSPGVARLCSPLEKCSSEPSVYDEPGAQTPDTMSASATGLPSCDQDLGQPRLSAADILSFDRGDLFQAEDGNCALLYELRSRVAGTVFPPTMIPEADVCGDLEKRNRRNTGGAPVAPPLPPFSAEGLIMPRKLVNPCLESAGHKNLHRELLFNHKIGRNVLNQKSELQKALEKHKDLQVKKDIQQQKESSKSALERVIEERAKRLEMLQKPEEEVKSPSGPPEFLQVHAKLRARMDSK